MNWIAVGLSADVPPGMVMPACVDQTDLAVWCSTSGDYHVWGDRCPHRGMRLSHGFVRGDTLSCIYHGWRYDEAGACDYIPAHPDLTPPKSICAQTYRAVCENGVIWTSLSETDDTPPSTEGLQPVRSLGVERSSDHVASVLGSDLAPLMGYSNTLTVVVQPSTDQSCVIHGLVPVGGDLSAASRELEQLRDQLERDAA